MKFAIARSEQKAWAASSTIPIPIRFLEAYIGRYAAPVIHEFRLRCVLNVTTAAANVFKSRDWPAALTQVRIADKSGDRVKVRGSSLRLIDQMEYGAAYRDGANVPATTTTNIEFYLRIPFNPGLRAKRRADFGINLQEFLDGGVVELTTSSATPNSVAGSIGTINSGSFTLYAKIVEEMEPEAKSRLTWRDYLIQQREDIYAAPGLLRCFIAYCGEVGVFNARTWGAQNITSNTLDFSLLPDTLLRDYDSSERPHRSADSAATILTEDEVVAGNVIPLVVPTAGQKLTDLPATKSVHFQFDGTLPATSDLPQVIIGCIVPRSDAQMSVLAPRASAAQRGEMVEKAGYIKQASGKHDPLQNYPTHLQTTLPVRLARDKYTATMRNARQRKSEA